MSIEKVKVWFEREYGTSHLATIIGLKDFKSVFAIMEEYAQKQVENFDNEALLGVVKISNWISVKDELPEEDNELLRSLDDDELKLTKDVIVITELGAVSENRRVKMAVGDKKWDWVMSYDGDDKVTHWIRYEEPK